MFPFWIWVDAHPAAYYFPALLATASVAWQAWHAEAHPVANTFRNRWGFPLSIFLLLIAWRWPQMITNQEINPDESQFIAGALTLRHDPVFWRSVDGMTSGPLISYALVPLSWFGLPLNFTIARCVGLFFLWLTFAAAYWQLLAHYNRRAACLGVAPAALLFSATIAPDFNHYASELIPIALLAGSSLLLINFPQSRRGIGAMFTGTLLAGLTPWAKLQSAPIAGTIVLIAVSRLIADPELDIRQKRKHMLVIGSGCFLPTVLAMSAIIGTNELGDFFRSYLVQNFHYTTPGLQAVAKGSHFLQYTFAVFGYAIVLIGALVLVGAAIVSFRRRRVGGWSTPLPAAMILLTVAICCVLIPGRDFLHYTFLLLPPLLLLSGTAVGEGQHDIAAVLPQHRFARIVVSLTFVSLLLLRFAHPNPPLLGHLAENARQPYSELGSLVRLLCSKRPILSVWGWQHEVYAEAGARQGTRNAYTYWEIVQSPQREYFRQRYLNDFAANRPTVFVDAVGDHTFYFGNRAIAAHETFPALATLIARDYCLVAELRYARVYMRRDQFASGNFSPTALWNAILAGRKSDYLDNAENQDLNLIALPKDKFDNRFVMMMRPPATASWVLDGTEREFRFGYGYKPEAIDQPDGNGTEFFLSLTAPTGKTRQLLDFLYDPTHNPGQRNHQNLRILLPPFIDPGTTLSLTTGPGPDNNNAWDWAYVAEVGLLHQSEFLPRQFPAFNRPPDSLDAPYSTIMNSGPDARLLLHAPASLRFVLKGHERMLQFTYGFLDGAYHGGKTNGATFRVRISSPGSPDKSLFVRQLDPVKNNGDQGEQDTTIELSDLQPSSVLEFLIEDDGDNSWDWTYISSLRLG